MSATAFRQHLLLMALVLAAAFLLSLILPKRLGGAEAKRQQEEIALLKERLESQRKAAPPPRADLDISSLRQKVAATQERIQVLSTKTLAPVKLSLSRLQSLADQTNLALALVDYQEGAQATKAQVVLNGDFASTLAFFELLQREAGPSASFQRLAIVPAAGSSSSRLSTTLHISW